jgi:signal transduction histidine kinase
VHLEETPKILVVNDDAGSLLALVGLLTEWAKEYTYEVVSARSGEEALRQVLQHDFAVILLDVNMPGMNGFETAEAIHMRARSASIPIIFITAYHADEMDRLKGYQTGAVDYLFTPIIPQILKAKLSVFVALAKKSLELESQAKVLDRRTSELMAINRRLEQEITEREVAERENKAKDEFLAMLGHELRNPLSAISSAAALIDANNVNPKEIHRAKDVIQRQSQHLRRIVSDLLDLSRVMSGKISLDKRPVDFSSLVNACIETLKIAGRVEHYHLTLHTEPAWTHADPSRLEQVITNVIDNALKYTPEGGKVQIDARTEGTEVVLIVRDSGVGIPADLLPRIFDVFVQGDRSLDRSEGGLGIGLALVRQLVRLHDGSISVNSRGHGCGSEFTIRLPKASEAESSNPAPVATLSNENCRVLLIEDNEDGREMMAMMLTAFGNEVLPAVDGHQGLQVAASQRPDIALVDIGLPGIDGYEVARRMRADPLTRHIKLIALTGYGLEDDRRLAIAAGFDRHLVKPVDLNHLMEAISDCLAAPVLEKVKAVG